MKSNRRAAGLDVDDFDDDTTADGTVSTFGPLSPVILASPLVNQQDDHGNTVLHIACSNKSIRAVSMLVNDLNARVDIKNRLGRVALHSAAASGHAEVVRILLDAKRAAPWATGGPGRAGSAADDDSKLGTIDGTILSIHSDERYIVPLDPITNFGETALEIARRLQAGGWQGGSTDPGDFPECVVRHSPTREPLLNATTQLSAINFKTTTTTQTKQKFPTLVTF